MSLKECIDSYLSIFKTHINFITIFYEAERKDITRTDVIFNLSEKIGSDLLKKNVDVCDLELTSGTLIIYMEGSVVTYGQ